MLGLLRPLCEQGVALCWVADERVVVAECPGHAEAVVLAKEWRDQLAAGRAIRG